MIEILALIDNIQKRNPTKFYQILTENNSSDKHLPKNPKMNTCKLILWSLHDSDSKRKKGTRKIKTTD